MTVSYQLLLQSTPLIADTLGPLHLSFIEGVSLIEGAFSIAGVQLVP